MWGRFNVNFYWMRTLDIANAKKEIKFRLKWQLMIKNMICMCVMKVKKYETKLGKFNCIKLKPLLQEGEIFKEGEGMTLWLTDDDNRIPVRIESELRVGRITCDLKAYGGNKYPFTSKVN